MRLLFLATGFAAVFVAQTLVLPSTAAAQTQSEQQTATPEVIDKMFECRAIADPQARLACFDSAVGAVFAARESNELVIAERAEVEEAKRGLFGLKLPKIKLFGGDEVDGEVDEISAILASASRLDSGRFIFELEDGARWIQTESAAGYKRYKAGDTIVIKKASLGSFKAKVNGGRAVRVRRIN